MEFKECLFEESPLKSTLNNTNQIRSYYAHTKNAFENAPNSKFWKEAFRLIETRFKQLKK